MILNWKTESLIDSLIIISYLVLTAYIGYRSSTGITSFREYAVSKRNYSTFAMVATIFSTLVGGGSTIGLSEQVFTIGILIILVNFGSVINKFLLAQFIVPKIYDIKQCISIGEIMKQHYGKTGQVLTGIAATLNSLGILAAQVFAITGLFMFFFGMGKMPAALAGMGIVLLYSSLGGIKAVVATDFMQFAVLIVAIPLVCSIGLNMVGGYNELMRLVPSNKLDFYPSKEIFNKYFAVFLMFVFLSLHPATVQRVLISKSKAQAVRAVRITGILLIPFFILVGLIGLEALVIKPDLEPSQALLFLTNDIMPVGVKGFVIAGLLAIIMSTADSEMNIAGLSAVHDVIKPLAESFTKMKIDSQQELKIARIVTFILGLAIIFIVMISNRIDELVLYAYKFWVPIIFFPFIMSLFGHKVSVRGLVVVVFIGMAGVIFTDLTLKESYGFDGAVPGFALNAFSFCFIMVIENPAKYFPLKKDNIFKTVFKGLYKRLKLKVRLLLSSNILNYLTRFSSRRVELHGAYYVPFGIFGTINYIVPYFMWAHETKNNLVTLLLRMVASVLSFSLVLLYEYLPENSNMRKKYLPLYWHVTVLFCLPMISIYTLLSSSFATTWLINASLSIFILAMLVDWLSFILITAFGSILGYFVFVLASGSWHIAEYQGENLFLMVYLTIFSILIGAFFLYQKDQLLSLVVRSKSDLEKLNKNLEFKINKRTNHLKKALNAKTEFLNNISHEVRTPLQGITGISTELVSRWEDLSEKQRYDYAKLVAQNGTRLINLVSNLLDLSKFDAGKMLFEMDAADILEVVRDIIDEQAPYLRDKPIDLRLQYNKNEDFRCLADKARIAQVVRNLLSNAMKFTQKGYILIKLSKKDISSWGREETEAIQLAVEDTGVGIARNELETIFKPFTQGSKTKTRAGGSGLGLAICHEIIQAHQGNMSASNNKAGGATISFLIPAMKIIDMKEQATINMDIVGRQIDEDKAAIFSLEGKKILLVDDEYSCLISGSLLLESMGCNVDTADGGKIALDKIAENNYDVVLLDLMMPDIYGLDVLKKLKANKATKSVPVILQSGASDSKEISKAFSYGARANISKPYDKTKMEKIIKEVLSNQ